MKEEKLISVDSKTAFVNGELVIVNGKFYTRLYTEEGQEVMKNTPTMSEEREKLIEESGKKFLKETNPELFKKIFPNE